METIETNQPQESEGKPTELTPRFSSEEELQLEIARQEEGEQKYIHTKRLDLLDENEPCFESLKQELQKSNGLLRVFVHPFHVQPDYGKPDRPDGQIDYKTYPPVTILRRVAAHSDRPPILLLVDEKNFDRERSVYEEFGEDVGTIYLAPTLHNNGFLKLIDIEDPKPGNESRSQLIHYGRMGMYRLNLLFSKLGVTKLLVNGSALKVANNMVSHCVGAFMLQMELVSNYLVDAKEEGVTPIRIQAGAGTVPDGRHELREEGFAQFL